MSSVSEVTPVETFLSSREFESAITSDDGLAARQHLAAGRAIYYGDAQYPEGLAKKFPDGRRQLVSVSAKGDISVIRDI